MDDSDGWTMNEWTLCHWTVFLKDGKLKIVNRRCSLQEKKMEENACHIIPLQDIE